MFQRVDRRLMDVSVPWRVAVLGVTVLFALAVRLWMVPADYVDLDGLNRVQEFGWDYWADSYTARVVSNDWRDMYTKRAVEQLPNEKIWSKASASPYPPASLMIMGAMHSAGEALGIGFYGMEVLLELLSMALALWYCWRTRWYVFVLLYTNLFVPFRFWWVGGASNMLTMLVLMVALTIAHRRPRFAHPVVALGICLKITPIFYLNNLLRLVWREATWVGIIVFFGLLAPLFFLEGYADIWWFHPVRDSAPVEKALAAVCLEGLVPLAPVLAMILPLVICGAFCLMLLHVQVRLHFDWEDRIGWCAVPMGLLFSSRMMSMRMLFLTMLLPDKRGTRSVFVFFMGLVDAAMFLAGLNPHSPVRDLIWDICGFSGLIAISVYLLHRANQAGGEAVKGPRMLSSAGIWALLKAPVEPPSPPASEGQ